MKKIKLYAKMINYEKSFLTLDVSTKFGRIRNAFVGTQNIVLASVAFWIQTIL